MFNTNVVHILDPVWTKTQYRRAWRKTVAALDFLCWGEKLVPAAAQEADEDTESSSARPCAEPLPHVFTNCGWDCHARIELLNHSRRCRKDNT